MAKIAEVQEVTRTKLKPYERNAKVHSPEQVTKIANSIREFGFLSPCLIDRDFNIIAGHGRVLAAEELGLETVPCVFIEGLTEEQRRAYILADNRLTELGDWDRDLVAEELGDLADAGFDVSLTGFDWDSVSKIEPIEDDYDPEDPELQIEHRTKRGDIFQLGDHRLVCGDSTNPKDMEALFDGGAADMVFTDPPYGVAIGSKNQMLVQFGKAGKARENIENDTLNEEDLAQVIIKAFAELKKHAADFCSYYVAAPAGELQLMMMAALKAAGLPVRHILIWVKNVATFSVGRLDYDYRHEPIFYTWTKSHKFRGGYDNTVIDESGRLEDLDKTELKELVHALRGDGSTTAIYCDKPTQSKLHPTMKPIRLVARFIYNSSEEGDVVADIFGGSGTTLIACEQLGRRCYMMELDPHYCDVIIDRWEKFTGRKAVKIDA